MSFASTCTFDSNGGIAIKTRSTQWSRRAPSVTFIEAIMLSFPQTLEKPSVDYVGHFRGYRLLLNCTVLYLLELLQSCIRPHYRKACVPNKPAFA